VVFTVPRRNWVVEERGSVASYFLLPCSGDFPFFPLNTLSATRSIPSWVRLGLWVVTGSGEKVAGIVWILVITSRQIYPFFLVPYASKQ